MVSTLDSFRMVMQARAQAPRAKLWTRKLSQPRQYVDGSTAHCHPSWFLGTVPSYEQTATPFCTQPVEVHVLHPCVQDETQTSLHPQIEIISSKTTRMSVENLGSGSMGIA